MWGRAALAGQEVEVVRKKGLSEIEGGGDGGGDNHVWEWR